jgi:hypothetical protein
VVTPGTLELTPTTEVGTKGTFGGIQPIFEEDEADPLPRTRSLESDRAGLERLRRQGAVFAFAISILGFVGLVGYELCLTAHADPSSLSLEVAGWRAAIIVSAALFSYALLRTADRLATPLDMLWKVDLERAKAKGRSSEEAAIEMMKAAAEVVAKLRG